MSSATSTTRGTARSLTALALPTALLALVSSCNDARTPTDGREGAAGAAAIAAQANVTVLGTIPLPVSQSGNTTAPTPLFALQQTGTGGVGSFRVSNSSNASPALTALSNGTGAAVSGTSTGTGVAGLFQITNAASGQYALYSSTAGTGFAAGFAATNASSYNPAVTASSNGHGGAVQAFSTGAGAALHAEVLGTGTGDAGDFIIRNNRDGGYGIAVNTFGPGFAGGFFGTTHGVYIQTTTPGGIGLQVNGGTKSAVVSTTTGARALYTEESTEVWFTDYGFGKLEAGRARILLDPTFAQTVNPEEPYHVFVEPYGRAQLYVAERTSLGFVVEVLQGDSAVAFSYRVVARRRGFETKRLEPVPWADKDLALQDARALATPPHER